MLFIIAALFIAACFFLIMGDLFGDGWLAKTSKVVFMGVPTVVAYLAVYLFIPSLVIVSLVVGLEVAAPHIVMFFGG